MGSGASSQTVTYKYNGGALNIRPRRSILTDVICSNNLDTIPSFKFKDCRKLRRVTFTPSLRRIENNAFESCTRLKEIDLEATEVTFLGDYAFYYAEHARKLTVPAVLEHIGDRAFYRCLGFEEVDLSKTKVKSIGLRTFCSCEGESMMMQTQIHTNDANCYCNN